MVSRALAVRKRRQPARVDGLAAERFESAQVEWVNLVRTNRISDNVLEISKVPCTLGGGGGCAGLLPRMLPPGSRLTVRGPDDYFRIFFGLADE